MINAKVKTTLSLGDIRLDLTKEFERIAKREIIPDIQGRINKGVDIDGNSYPELSPVTIALKKKRGHRLEPLIATGQLRRSIDYRTLGMNRVLISFKGQRKDDSLSNLEVAEKLQLYGVDTKYGKRYFKFFGISDKAEAKAMKSIRQWIKKEIDNARPKQI